MKPELTISIIALLISIISLIWKIWFNIFDFRKKLQIKCYKTNETCVITLTNIGNKPIYIRRIEIWEKKGTEIFKPNIEYHKYSDKFELNAIMPDTWRTIIIEQNKSFTLLDLEKKDYKKTQIIVIEPSGKKHKTKWFRQNNLR